MDSKRRQIHCRGISAFSRQVSLVKLDLTISRTLPHFQWFPSPTTTSTPQCSNYRSTTIDCQYYWIRSSCFDACRPNQVHQDLCRMRTPEWLGRRR
jgi:hypothetical protein